MQAWNKLIEGIKRRYPNRICETVQSTIDFILVSDKSKISQSGVLVYGISDNFITFCTRRIFKDIFKYHKTIRIRALKKYCVEKFREEVGKIDWSPVLESVGVDSAWEDFKCRFLDVVNVMAPIKRVGVKQRSSPWFNHEMLESLQARNKALRNVRTLKISMILSYINVTEMKHRAGWMKLRGGTLLRK